jgi:hypothetical protein
MEQPRLAVGTGMPNRERFRMCEVPRGCALLPQDGLADAITPDQVSAVLNAAAFSRNDGSTVGTVGRRRSFNHSEYIWAGYSCL